MGKIGLLIDCLITFVITFIASSMVTLLYNIFTGNNAVPDWSVSIRFSVIFAIVLPVVNLLEKKRKVS
ncbi:MAG TPA: hypothetical protein VHO03_20105 [Ignavibacteriales bacterium]|nr:hypothetical protein [Ignavibacteriales bacterium]